MNLSDKILDESLSRQLDLNRYVGQKQNDIAKYLYDLTLDIEEQFKGDLTEYNKARLTDLFREIKALTAETFGVIIDDITSEIAELASDEARIAAAVVNQAAGFELMAALPTAAAIDRLARNVVIENVPMSDWLSRNQGDFFFRTQQAVRTGISLGETNGQIMKRIRQSGELKQVAKNGDVIGVTSRNLNAIVRTAVQDVAGQATLATYAENKNVIKSVYQISTIDSRTSIACQAYASKQWDMETKEPIGHDLPFVNAGGSSAGTPRHWGCRSRISVRTKSFAELGLPIDEYKPSVRASMDGEMPAEITFEQFLEKKGRAFTDKMLGPGRAELYLSKKLSLADLLDARGNPLTLAELKAKYQ